MGTLVAVEQHCHTHRKLCSVLATLGSGVGAVILQLFLRYTIDEYGIRGALLLLSGVVFHACVAGSVMVSIKPMGDVKQSRLFEWSVFRNYKYVTWSLFCTVASLTGQTAMLVIVDHGTAEGFSELQSTSMLSIMTILGIPGRVIVGLIAHVLESFAYSIGILIQAFQAALIVLFPYVHSYDSLMGLSAAYGFCGGGRVSMLPVVTISLVDAKEYASAYRGLTTAMGIGILLAGPLAGRYNENHCRTVS